MGSAAGLDGAGGPPTPWAPVLAPDDPLVLVAARELARKAALAEALSQACTAPLLVPSASPMLTLLMGVQAREALGFCMATAG